MLQYNSKSRRHTPKKLLEFELSKERNPFKLTDFVHLEGQLKREACGGGGLFFFSSFHGHLRTCQKRDPRNDADLRNPRLRPAEATRNT